MKKKWEQTPEQLARACETASRATENKQLEADLIAAAAFIKFFTHVKNNPLQTFYLLLWFSYR